MLQVFNVSKTYGKKKVLSEVSFTAAAGKVTGFLGPNGAGKSTTMRIMLGLAKADAGSTLVNGKPYPSLRSPLGAVGSLLEAKSAHPARSAYKHLLAIAATHGIGAKRVEEVIDMTGLEKVAKKRVKGFSLGMGQRLGIAAALLGDPENLILDEPINGLDPNGVLWVRDLLKSFAAQGRTVFLSSHLMSEMALTADHIVVIGKGKILADNSLSQFLEQAGPSRVQISTDNVALLQQLVAVAGGEVHQVQGQTLEVSGLSVKQISQLAFEKSLFVYDLKTLEVSLEDAYLALTQKEIEYVGKTVSRKGGK